MQLPAIIEQENRLTEAFTPEKAKIYDSFEVETHFNLVVRCPASLQGAIAGQITGLTAYPEVAQTSPGNYHMTILIFPVAAGTQAVLERVRFLAGTPLQLQVKGLHVRPVGIFANVYDPNEKLAHVRQQLAKLTGVDFDPADRLANVGWITLARFTAPVSPDTIKWVQQGINLEFGTLNSPMELYKSSNRQKLGDKIW